MNARYVLVASATALFPTAACAHGDHEGLHGLIHILTEPLHLGGLLLLGTGALLLGRHVKAVLRRRAAQKARKD